MKRLIDSVVLLTFLIKQIITLLVQFMLTGNTTRFSETGTRHATRVPAKYTKCKVLLVFKLFKLIANLKFYISLL